MATNNENKSSKSYNTFADKQVRELSSALTRQTRANNNNNEDVPMATITRRYSNPYSRSIQTKVSADIKDFSNNRETDQLLNDMLAQPHTTDDSTLAPDAANSSLLSESSFSTTTQAPIRSNKKPTSKSLALAAQLQTKTQYDIATKMMKSQSGLSMRLHADMMAQNANYYTKSLGILSNIDRNTKNIASFQVSVQAEYYKKSLETKSSILDEIRDLNKNLKLGFNINNRGVKTEEPFQSKALARSMFGGDFKNSLKAGFGKLARNSNSATSGIMDMLPILMDGVSMGLNTRSLASMGVRAGAQTLSKKYFGSNKTGKAGMMFNDPGEALTNMMNGWSYSSGIKGMLGRAFGDDIQKPETVDYAKLRLKDPRANSSFDNAAHTALTKLIPTSLSVIESALTGRDFKLYNYNTGKYDLVKDKAKSTSNMNKNMKSFQKNIDESVLKENDGYFDKLIKTMDAEYMDEFSGIFNDKEKLKMFSKYLVGFLIKLKHTRMSTNIGDIIQYSEITAEMVQKVTDYDIGMCYYISSFIEKIKAYNNDDADSYWNLIIQQINPLQDAHKRDLDFAERLNDDLGVEYIQANMLQKTMGEGSNKKTQSYIMKDILNATKAKKNSGKNSGANKLNLSYNGGDLDIIEQNTTIDLNNTWEEQYNKLKLGPHGLETPASFIKMQTEKEIIEKLGPMGLPFYNKTIASLKRDLQRLESQGKGDSKIAMLIENTIDTLEEKKSVIFKRFEEQGGVESITKEYEKNKSKYNINTASLDNPMDAKDEILQFAKNYMNTYKGQQVAKLGTTAALGVGATMLAKKMGYGKYAAPLLGASLAGGLAMNSKFERMVSLLGDRGSEKMDDGRTRMEALQAKMMQDMMPAGLGAVAGLKVGQFVKNYVPYGPILGPVMGYMSAKLMMKASKGILGKVFGGLLGKGLDMLGGFGQTIKGKLGMGDDHDKYSYEDIVGTEDEFNDSMAGRGDDKFTQSKFKNLKLASGASLDKVGCGIMSMAFASTKLTGSSVIPEDLIPIANKYIDTKTGGIKVSFFSEVGSRLGFNTHIMSSQDKRLIPMLKNINSKNKIVIALNNVKNGHYIVGYDMIDESLVKIFDPNDKGNVKQSLNGLRLNSSYIIILEGSTEKNIKSTITTAMTNIVKKDNDDNNPLLSSGTGGDATVGHKSQTTTTATFKKNQIRPINDNIIAVKILGGQLDAVGAVGAVDVNVYREKMNVSRNNFKVGLGNIGANVKSAINTMVATGDAFFRSNKVAKTQGDYQEAQEGREKENTSALLSIAGKDKVKTKEPVTKKDLGILGLLGGLLGLNLLNVYKNGASIQGPKKILGAITKFVKKRFSDMIDGMYSGAKKLFGKFGIKLPNLTDDAAEGAVKIAAQEGAENIAKEGVENTTEKVAKGAADAAIGKGGKLAKVLAKAKDFLTKVFKIIPKIPIIGKLAAKLPLGKMTQAFETILNKLAKKAVAEGAEAGVKIGVKGILSGAKQALSSTGVGIAINLAFYTFDVIQAVSHAHEYFGVKKTEVTIPMKVAAGISGLILSMATSIPFIGWLFILATPALIVHPIYKALGGVEPNAEKDPEENESVEISTKDNKEYVDEKYGLNENGTVVKNESGTTEGQKQVDAEKGPGGKGSWGGFVDDKGNKVSFTPGSTGTTASTSSTSTGTVINNSTSSNGKPKFFSQNTFMSGLSIGSEKVKDSGCALAVAKMITDFMKYKYTDSDLYKTALKFKQQDNAISIKYFEALGGNITDKQIDVLNALTIDGTALAILKDGHFTAVLSTKGKIFYGDPEGEDFEEIKAEDGRLQKFTGAAIFGAIASKLTVKSSKMAGRGPKKIGFGNSANAKIFDPSSAASSSKSSKPSSSSTSSSDSATTPATPAQAAPASTSATTIGGIPMSGDFAKAVEMMFTLEGGYSNDKYDHGGETMFGIIEAEARKAGYNGPMKDLPKEKAKEIYKQKYWDAYGIPQLKNFPVQAAVMNSAVNAGLGRPSRIITAMFGLPSSGASKLQPDWANKLNAMQPNDAANKIINAQDADYERIISKDPTQSKWRKGWHNRSKQLKQMLGLTGGAAGNLGGDAFVSQKSISIAKESLGKGTATVSTTGCAIAVAKMILNYIGHSRKDEDLLKIAKTYATGDQIQVDYFVHGLGGKLGATADAVKKHLEKNGNCAAILTNWGGRGHYVAVFKDRDKLYLGDPQDTVFRAKSWEEIVKLGFAAAGLFSASEKPAKSVTTTSAPTGAIASQTVDPTTSLGAAAPPAPPAARSTAKGGSQWGGFMDATGKLFSFAAPAAAAATATTGAMGGPAPWVDVAKSLLGKDEKNDPGVIGPMLQAVGGGSDPTKVSWCAAFVSHCIRTAIPSFKGSASSQYPTESKEYTKLSAPQYGAIIVWKSNGKNGGHTAFYLGPGNSAGKINTIGGNQSGKGEDSGIGGAVTTGDTTETSSSRSLVGYYWPSATGSAPADEKKEMSAGASAGNGKGGDGLVMDVKKPINLDNIGSMLFGKKTKVNTTANSRTNRSLGHNVPSQPQQESNLTSNLMKLGSSVLKDTNLGNTEMGKMITGIMDLVSLTKEQNKIHQEVLSTNAKQEKHQETIAKHSGKPTTVVTPQIDNKASGEFDNIFELLNKTAKTYFH